MKIKTIDGSGRAVSADVSDTRVAQWQHYLASHPGILGMGAGEQFGKGSARDAGEALAFAVPQLAFVEPGVYAKEYPQLLFEQLLGSAIQVNQAPWATSIVYEISDYSGKGRRLANGTAGDVPYADVASARISKEIQRGGIAYRYSTEDLRISAYLQRPLPTRKLEAALLAFRQHMNDVALIGEAQSNFTGLFNNASVTAANRPSGAVWTAATADTIISDITALLTNVMTASGKTTNTVKIIALDVVSFQILMRPRSTNSDTTIKSFMEQSYPGLQFIAVPQLATLGAGPSKRMVGFSPDDNNMAMHITMDVTWRAPQEENFDTKILGEYKYGGLEIRRPYTMYYMDGI